jgi:hypothetical protein
LVGVPLFIAVYQFACDQFAFPTIPTLWNMTGLPWWAWLFFAQTGVLYGVFEYVRRMETQPQAVATPAGAPPEATAADKKRQALQTLSGVRSSIETVLGPYHEEADHERVFHAVEAAMLTISRQFGIKMLNLAETNLDYERRLEIYAAYIDRFYPMLVEGHTAAAKAKAADFKRREGI